MLMVASACADRTHVELDSAQGPAVQLVDGAGGQNEASVVGAGVVEIGDLPMPITTPTTASVAPSVAASERPATTTTSPPDDQPGGDQAEADPAAAMIAEFCSTGRRNLLVAVETYRDEFGSPPTSELDLLAAGYIRELSDVFDVRVDGSIVATDETCAD